MDEPAFKTLRLLLVVVPLTLQIPAAALTALPTGTSHDGSFSVYVAWSGAGGEVSDVTKSRGIVRVDLPEGAWRNTRPPGNL